PREQSLQQLSLEWIGGQARVYESQHRLWLALLLARARVVFVLLNLEDTAHCEIQNGGDHWVIALSGYPFGIQRIHTFWYPIFNAGAAGTVAMSPYHCQYAHGSASCQQEGYSNK